MKTLSRSTSVDPRSPLSQRHASITATAKAGANQATDAQWKRTDSTGERSWKD
ncbi:hypothetical protein [Lysobacter gummosus]|uniref:hypothetical protein n=1 Tax=Lysobacter gummosus TaxID=262324 RepID=UPI0036310581